MSKNGFLQLAMIVDTNDQKLVIEECRDIVLSQYDVGSFAPVGTVASRVVDLFGGNFPGYRACNTEYHNLRHTFDTFLATARLVYGWNLVHKRLQPPTAQNLLIAALLHDTGYIQKNSDTIGTGAKYAKTHVKRSNEFLVENGTGLGIDQSRMEEISRYIMATGGAGYWLGTVLADRNSAWRIIGTADLLSQMADRVYLERLLFLYYECQEADPAGFQTEFDILSKTLGFYESTMARLKSDFGMCYTLAQEYFKARHDIDENLYIVSIENQMNYLKNILNDKTSNFRKKLRRLDIAEIEKYLTD